MIQADELRAILDWADAFDRAHAAGKPVVAYKLGRSALGERLARSHTGALAGSDVAFESDFAGIVGHIKCVMRLQRRLINIPNH